MPEAETDAPPSTTTTTTSADTDPSSASAPATSSTSPVGDTTSTPTSLDPSTSSGSVASASSSTGAPVDPSLVLWLDFDGDPADWLDDRSAYGNHGSCGTACPSITPGVLGDAASFDGTAFVVVEHDTSLLTPDGFTLALWHRLDTVPAEHSAILTKTVGVDVYNSWELLYYPTTCADCPLFAMAFDAANVVALGESSAVEQWIHLAATWDGEAMALFVDGQLTETRAIAELAMDEHPILVGADDDSPPDGYTGHFIGAIDDVRIYDRVLDEAELTELAQPP